MTMTPERLDEIRSDIESYENHQRYGPHELPYRTIERLECDEFPEYIVELLAAYDSLTAEIDRLKGEVERLMANKWLFIPEEDVCKKCSGIGRRAYSSTATWRGGIGGQAITEDVCDSCWGTGRIDRKGFDIRKFGAEMKALRTRLDALVTAGEAITFAWNYDGEITQEQLDALAAAVEQAKGEK